MKITRLAPDERGKPRVSVFRRGSTFYARFRIQNKTISSGNLYITETLKTSNEHEANQKAYERLLEIKLAEKKGSSLNKDTVAEAIDDFITEYEVDLPRDYPGIRDTCSANTGKQSVVTGKIMLAKSLFGTFHCLRWKPTKRGERITGSTGWTNKKRKKGEVPQSDYAPMVPSGCLRMPAYAHLIGLCRGK
jgi:hypothetical protein